MKIAKSSYSTEELFCNCIVPQKQKLEDLEKFIIKLDKALKVTKK